MADAPNKAKVGVLKATEMMTALWPSIAPWAYSRYLKRGRGGVLIPVGSIKLRAGGQGIVDTDMRYVTADDIASGKVIVPPDTAKEIAAYDPDSEVLFLFDEGRGIATYRGRPSGAATPKELYERSQPAR